jgi:hypothetical protein
LPTCSSKFIREVLSRKKCEVRAGRACINHEWTRIRADADISVFRTRHQSSRQSCDARATNRRADTERLSAVITEDGIACEHPKRQREFIRWSDVTEISVRTTSDGPWLPDVWVLFVGETGGCSIPTEAVGFEAVHESLKRFHGFDFGCFLKGGTNDALHIGWKKSESYA